jgi:predicted GH43/DUF377 family glycosyl hydrolase
MSSFLHDFTLHNLTCLKFKPFGAFYYAILCLYFCGCTPTVGINTRPIESTQTHLSIKKGEHFLEEGMESTPVVLNGQLLYIISKRLGTEAVGHSIEVWDTLTHTKLAEHATNLGLISALVVDRTLYVFGTTNWGNDQNSIEMIQTTDFIHWSSPRQLFSAPAGTTYFNTSVTQLPDQSYIMTYEVCSKNSVCFNARFKSSSDLINWNDVGGVFEKGFYTACPTIRYSGSYYYLFFLSHFYGFYATMISRSRDLKVWETSKQLVLSPLDGGDRNKNASDFDLVEINNQIHMLYSTGSQENPEASYQGIREAIYQGSLSDFVDLFFLKSL